MHLISARNAVPVARASPPVFHCRHARLPAVPPAAVPACARRHRSCGSPAIDSLDIVHAHYAVPHATAAYLARRYWRRGPVPVPRTVTTLHGTDITLVGNDRRTRRSSRSRSSSRRRHGGIARASRATPSRTLGISREIDVIPNFLDARYRGGRPELRARAGRPDREARSSCTSRTSGRSSGSKRSWKCSCGVAATCRRGLRTGRRRS